MRPRRTIAVDHAANREVLAYLGAPQRRRRSVSTAATWETCAPSDIPDPYSSLGTHPDLVTRLWDELAAGLPADCRWVVWGTPSLVRPDTGVIFGFAGGTHTYALRLPPQVRAAAVSAGAATVHHYPAHPALGIQTSSLDASDLGVEWMFGGWFAAEREWCSAAYDHAGPSAISQAGPSRP